MRYQIVFFIKLFESKITYLSEVLKKTFSKENVFFINSISSAFTDDLYSISVGQ